MKILLGLTGRDILCLFGWHQWGKIRHPIEGQETQFCENVLGCGIMRCRSTGGKWSIVEGEN